jgi:hypothetical protein
MYLMDDCIAIKICRGIVMTGFSLVVTGGDVPLAITQTAVAEWPIVGQSGRSVAFGG